MRLRLTKMEARVLLDRLSIGDALAECLSDYGSPLEDVNPAKIEEVANALACRCEQIIEHRARGGILTFSMLDRRIATEVLRDAIEGATLAYRIADACEDGDMSRTEKAKWFRAMRSVEQKVRQSGIEHTGFPPQ